MRGSHRSYPRLRLFVCRHRRVRLGGGDEETMNDAKNRGADALRRAASSPEDAQELAAYRRQLAEYPALTAPQEQQLVQEMLSCGPARQSELRRRLIEGMRLSGPRTRPPLSGPGRSPGGPDRRGEPRTRPGRPGLRPGFPPSLSPLRLRFRTKSARKCGGERILRGAVPSC